MSVDDASYRAIRIERLDDVLRATLAHPGNSLNAAVSDAADRLFELALATGPSTFRFHL